MRSRFLAPIALLLVLIGAGVYWFSRKEAPLAPELATPRLVLEALKGSAPPVRSLFFTPATLPFISEVSGATPSPEELPALIEAFTAACHNPGAWRALDRKYRFDVLWLMGDPAEFRPLLDHLQRSPDWTLTYLDPTSFLYRRRPAPEWTPEALTPLKERLSHLSARDQATARAHLAQRLTTLNQHAASKPLLEEAIALDPDSAPAWTQLSAHHGIMGRWEEALGAAQKALDADRRYYPALAAKANALYAFGKFNDALPLTRRLVAERPNEGSALYLHARVTQAARAYQEEIEVLEKIIAIGQESHLPVGTWQVYLGQAYSRVGKAEAALEAFRAALKDTTLGSNEREFARKGLEKIGGEKIDET